VSIPRLLGLVHGLLSSRCYSLLRYTTPSEMVTFPSEMVTASTCEMLVKI
jgi:hypothetical protein